MQSKKTSAGFTLIELMIVIAIIGILAAVAVPQYGSYTKRAKFTELVTQARGVKLSVEVCIQHQNTPDDCDGGENGVTRDYNGTGIIQSIETIAGKITATGTDVVDQKTYIIDPIYFPSTNSLQWTYGGNCEAARLC